MAPSTTVPVALRCAFKYSRWSVDRSREISVMGAGSACATADSLPTRSTMVARLSASGRGRRPVCGGGGAGGGV
eukprot:352908-Chlamydomonas_euryale.AAC.9